MYAVLRGARVCKSFAHVHLSVLTTAPEVGDVPIVQVRKLRLRERLSTRPRSHQRRHHHLWAPAQPLPASHAPQAAALKLGFRLRFGPEKRLGIYSRLEGSWRPEWGPGLFP